MVNSTVCVNMDYLFRNNNDPDVACRFRCWMTDSSSALIAHYVINTGLLLMVVSSGLVMLLLVFRKIRHRNEWRTNCMTFLSIWGLSCLFGSTWAVIFIPSGTSETSLFLFCIINSLQGEFLGGFSPFLLPHRPSRRAAS